MSSSNADQEGEQQQQGRSSAATETNTPIPQSLGNIDKNDISLHLSLIKGLHHHDGQSVKASRAAADSLSSESITSDMDDSGGDETGGSNTSSGTNVCLSLSGVTCGPMSSLSSDSRTGILRKNGNNASKSDSISTSSASDDIARDELSMCVVARAKSHQQPPQIKDSFTPDDQHFAGDNKGSDCGGSENGIAPGLASTKGKRKSDSSWTAAEDQDAKKKARTVEGSVAFSDSNSGMLPQKNEQSAVTKVSSVSSDACSRGSGKMTQSTGQDSSSNTDQATSQNSNQSSSSTSPSLGCPVIASSKQPHLNQLNKYNMSSEERRLDRNQREKERSNLITSQMDSLRCLLQRGGLCIPKNTQSAVLSDTSNYIRTLQHREQLMSMEMENLKGQLRNAMAAKRGLQADVPCQHQQDQITSNYPTGSEAQDYYLIFNNTMAGMAVASMGGALLACNAAFRAETGLAIKKDSGTSIFNIIHPKDLSRSLELLKRMVDAGHIGNGTNHSSARESSSNISDEPIFIRSSFPTRPDLGLCITLVRNEDKIPKFLGITLVKNTRSRGKEFNPSSRTVLSMAPQISTPSTLSEAQARSQPAVTNFRVQPQANEPQVQPQWASADTINNAALNNSISRVRTDHDTSNSNNQ